MSQQIAQTEHIKHQSTQNPKKQQQSSQIVTIINDKKLSYNSSDLSKLNSINNSQRVNYQGKKANKFRFEHKNKQNNKTFTSITILNSKNNYVNFGLTKMQPQLARMSFPYCMEEEPEDNNSRGKQVQVKVTNRVFTNKRQSKNHGQFDYNKLSNEEPPVNQYLCYDLSKDINNGLYEVKVLAQEIKKIKKQKQEILEDRQKYKPVNKIRITRGFRNPGLCKGTATWQKQFSKTAFR